MTLTVSNKSKPKRKSGSGRPKVRCPYCRKVIHVTVTTPVCSALVDFGDPAAHKDPQKEKTP